MQTKTCHSCAEEIKEAAKQCPHCHCYQKGMARILKDPFFGTLIGITIGFALISWFFATNFKDPIYDADQYLKVSDTTVQFVDASCGRQVSIVGTIGNSGTEKLTDIVFDVEFFDKDGNLVDAFSDSQWDLILTEGDSKSFKVRGDSGADEKLYVSHKITIAKAEVDGW